LEGTFQRTIEQIPLQPDSWQRVSPMTSPVKLPSRDITN
jgi:hypothetical protein